MKIIITYNPNQCSEGWSPIYIYLVKIQGKYLKIFKHHFLIYNLLTKIKEVTVIFQKAF